MQGVPAGFALTAIANYLAGRGSTSQTVGSFVAIVGLPWVLQFIWGPLIDRYQYSVIGHRKQWVVLTQLMAFAASLSLLLVEDPLGQITLMTAAFFTHSIFASVQDASVDAIAIDVLAKEERGRVNAFMRAGFLLGISLGAAGLSTVLHRYGFFYAALCQSAFLLLFTLVTFFIKLDRHDRLLPSFGKNNTQRYVNNNPDLGWLFRQLYKGITQPANLRLFLAIALVYLLFSIFIRSYSYHLVKVLRWPDNELSVLQGGIGSLTIALVAISGGVIADKIGPQKLMLRVMIILGVFLLIFSGLAGFWVNKAFTTTGLVFWNLADPLFSVAAMPLLMALCIDKVEGSQFTTYMALVNFCDVLGSYLSGWALAIIPAPVLGIACGVVLLAVALISWYKVIPALANTR